MFINTMKNDVARHILSRIYAIHLAQAEDKYIYAATIVEAANWASDYMQKTHDEKTYCSLHKFWRYASKKCDEVRFQPNPIVFYGCHDRYNCKPPNSALHCIWSEMRSAKCRTEKHRRLTKEQAMTVMKEGYTLSFEDVFNE